MVAIYKSSFSSEFSKKIPIVWAPLSLLPLSQGLFDQLWQQFSSHTVYQNSAHKFLLCVLPFHYFSWVKDCSSSCYDSYLQVILFIRIQQENFYFVWSHITTSIGSRTARAAAKTAISKSYCSSELRKKISTVWALLLLVPFGQGMLEQLLRYLFPRQPLHQNSAWKFLLCVLPCHYFKWVKDWSTSYGSHF